MMNNNIMDSQLTYPHHDQASRGLLERLYFATFLTDSQDNSNTNANGDYSSAQRRFTYRNGQSDIFYITSLTVEIEDATTIDSGNYGDGITLTNGISVEVNSHRYGIQYINGQDKITTNTHWAIVATDSPHIANHGAGNQSAIYKIDFNKTHGFVRLEKGECFDVILNDDFSGLTSHRFFIQGHRVMHDDTAY